MSVTLYCALLVNTRVEWSIVGSKWAQMPVVEKAFEGVRLNPTKTTYVRARLCIFCSNISTSTSKGKHGYWTFEYLFS